MMNAPEKTIQMKKFFRFWKCEGHYYSLNQELTRYVYLNFLKNDYNLFALGTFINNCATRDYVYRDMVEEYLDILLAPNPFLSVLDQL